MEYKKYDMKSYNVYTIKTDKFKTIRMDIMFSKEVVKEEMPIMSFLADIISYSSKKYPQKKDMVIRQEELYKPSCFATTNKNGNLFSFSLVFDFIDPEYIEEEDYLENVLSFPFEILNNPNVKNKEFDITSFNIIKRRISEEILSIKENPERLAIINALNVMDSNSPSAFRVIGTLDDLEKITPSSLYEAYENLFKHYNCDIFISGNANMDKIVSIIKNKFKKNVIKLRNRNYIVKNIEKKKPIIKSEGSNFVQSTLVMIYNIKSLSKEMKNIAFYVFNYIFGSGGLKSKLYTSLRTENSLCYGVRSLYLKYDELLIIEVSLDKSNVLKARKLIDNCVLEMVKGNFDDEVLSDAIKNIKFSLKSSLDSQGALQSNYIFNVLDDLPLIEERIDLFGDVQKKEIIDCAKSLVLNTVYILDAGEENERN